MSAAKPNTQSPEIQEKNERTEIEWRSNLGDEEGLVYQPQKSRSLFGRFLDYIPGMTARQRNGDYAYDYHAAPSDEDLDPPVKAQTIRRASKRGTSRWLRRLKKTILALPVVILSLFGLLHIILVMTGRKQLFWDVDEYEPYLPKWKKASLATYPTDATRNVVPIPCNSHNDYWRRVPLFDALHYGCTSVEVDVWQFAGKEHLFVGHNTASLSRNRTFTSLYIDPLVDLLDSMNPNNGFNNEKGHGVFDMNPEQTLVLLVDFKTDGHDLYPHVQKQLEPLRQKNYLSYWDGEQIISRAVTVVGTGNAPFNLIIQNKHKRDMFFDAPLDEMWEAPREASEVDKDPVHRKRVSSPGQGKTGIDIVSSPDDFNTSNSYFASGSFMASIGYPLTGRLSEKQIDLIRGQIRGAKRRGLKARYWETPSWPTSLRNYVWQILVDEGADILSVDDLKGAASMDWSAYVRHD